MLKLPEQTESIWLGWMSMADVNDTQSTHEESTER
jgi:hypothetical protein